MYLGARVAVVIPAHDEERLIGDTLAGVPPFVDDVVVVDDASRDGTARVVATRREARVHLHVRQTNGGVGAAILDGYSLAFARGADVIVVVGADGQMDPGEMPRLLDEVVSGRTDYAKGSRLGHPELRQRMPPTRLVGNVVLSWLTRLALARDIRDSQCGYAALRASRVPELPFARLYKRYGFPNDLLATLLEQGARVSEVPVTPIYGDEDSGIRVSRTALPLLLLLTRIAWRRHQAGLRAGERPCAS